MILPAGRYFSHLLCLLLMAVSSAEGQVTHLHFGAITINDGLSQGYISCITQDRQGFMWFATGDGLNKYDGYTFTVYHHNPDDPTSIASDDLTYVFEDSQQRLWIGTRNNGLDYFDRRTNTFYHFRSSGPGSILSDKVGVISEDRAGALWVSTDEGSDRLDILPMKDSSGGKGFLAASRVKFTPIKADRNFIEKKPNSLVRGSFFTDSRGHTYVATANRVYEMVSHGKDAYSFVRKFETPVHRTDFLSVLLEDTVSYSLFLNSESVIRFPGYDFNLPHTVYDYRDHVPGHVCVMDKNQMLWMIEDNGLRRIHIPDNEQRYFEPADPSQTDALRTTTCMFSDRQGVLWIGTGGYGILKYDPEKERFHHILPNSRQYQILEVQPETIMTNNFDKITLNRGQAPRLEERVLMEPLRGQFAGHNVIGFARDGLGTVWIPDGKNIYSYQLLTKEQHVYDVSKGSDGGQVYPLYADGRNRLWFGLKGRFCRFEPPDKISSVGYPLKTAEFEDDFLQAIFEDGNTLWLGTIHGLFRYNISSGEIEAEYHFVQNDSSSLGNDFVYSFCNDIKEPGRYLWVGTKGGGLSRLDKDSGRFVRYSTRNGLANNVIYGILPGDDGCLWLSTNKGLSAFDPASKTFRNYDVDDGLQSNEFNRYAYCKTSDGLLVFGGMNGINYFDPRDIRPLEPPDVSFTDFRLFNKPVNIKDPDAPLKENINYAKAITLAYEQNVITFQFSAMDYRRQGNIVYRYKMEGFDKDWIYTGRTHEATYTNLDPGEYSFVVQASFESNLWSEQRKSVRVIILTPWYKTWWFYLLMALAASAILYAMYRFRISQLRRMDKLRNRIARDLHDEVGSSISTISIYSKIMQEQIDSMDFDNKPLVGKINAFAAEIMESMNDIIWNINTSNDTFERIISRMREQASQLLEAKGYTVHFIYNDTLGRMKLNMDRRREFYLIYKEAINNIAKYAEGTNVWISLSADNGPVILSIKDDGIGFDKKHIRSGGNGLGNMQHRAELLKGDIAIISTPGGGTEIILKFHIG